MHCEFIREVCGDKVCLIALKQLDLENEWPLCNLEFFRHGKFLKINVSTWKCFMVWFHVQALWAQILSTHELLTSTPLQ
jgi:hypothetical protein